MKNEKHISRRNNRIAVAAIFFVFLVVVPILTLYGVSRIPIVRSAVTKIKSETGLGESWSNRNIARTKKRGSVVIKAIEFYRQNHASLPASLDELKPKYIKKMHNPKIGNQKWFYHIMSNDNTSYYLDVESQYNGESLFNPNPELLRYTSTSKKWSLVDNDF